MAPQLNILPGPRDIFSDITGGIGDITSRIGGIFDPTPTSLFPSTASESSSIIPSSSSSSSVLPSESVSSSIASTTTETTSSISSLPPSTVTNILTRTAELPVQSSTATVAPSGFLQNKGLSGFVFALVGIISLAIILSVVMFFVRRHQRKKLLEEAVSFEPSSSRMYLDEMEREDHVWEEKSGGYSDAGHGYGAYGSSVYSMPAKPPTMYYEATPPSQLAYSIHGNYPAIYNSPQPYDGVTSVSDPSSSHASHASQSGLGQNKAQPALPGTFEDTVANLDRTPEPVSGSGPLKIANQ